MFLDEYDEQFPLEKNKAATSNKQCIINILDQKDHRNLEKLLEHFEHELQEQYMHLTLILQPFSNEKQRYSRMFVTKNYLQDIHEQHLYKLPEILQH
jgi:hypothetical protein